MLLLLCSVYSSTDNIICCEAIMVIWLKDFLRRKENVIGLGILPFMLIFIALGTPALNYIPAPLDARSSME